MITTQAQIIELEQRLRQAMLGSDIVELDALIAPELLFTNHLGQISSFLGSSNPSMSERSDRSRSADNRSLVA
jgi:hypothetical protein